MLEQKVSYRYARALLELAEAEGKKDIVMEDLEYITKVFSLSDELKSIVKNPVFNLWKKKNIFKDLFENKVDKLTLSFLLLLIDKKRASLIEGVAYQYKKLYYISKNMLEVEITSAISLDDEMKNRIIKKLTDMTSMKIVPNFKIDDKIKGGIIVRIGDWVYDASISNMLSNLYEKLALGETNI